MATYSHSRLETYRNCPRQYKLQYIDRVEIEEIESIEAFMGGRVHETLEKLYKDVRMTKVPTLEELTATYERLWETCWHPGVTIVKSEYAPEHYRRLGRKCVADYYEQYHPFDQGRVISIEQLVFFPLDEDEQYWIRGVIDRVDIAADGTYEVHDYKTSGRLPSQRALDEDRQLALYHLAIKRMWPDIGHVDLVWHYLAFAREMRSTRSPEDLEALKAEVMGLISQVETDLEFRPRESALCDWCPYQEYCPAKKHAVMIGRLGANEYLGEPGVKLANKLSELTGRKKEIDDELNQVKAALIDYARENNVEVVKGSDSRVLVRFYKGLAFPTKDQPGREELEQMVKDLGLWERVSVMSPVSLAKLVESGRLDQAIIDQISRLGWEEERPWVKLTGLKRGRVPF
jgi:putative RecB family exonuclease